VSIGVRSAIFQTSQGKWPRDRAFDRARAEQDAIAEELWK
jgi:hypothetical protein